MSDLDQWTPVYDHEHDAGPGTLADMTARQVVRLRAQAAAKKQLAAEAAGNIPLRLGRRTIRDLVSQSLDELAVRHEYGVTGFSTGLTSLDEHLSPALQPGRVVGLAADTKSGKTALGGNLVVSFACQGVPVLLGSFEDQQTDTVYRYLANLTSGDVGIIRDGFRTRDGRKLAIPADFDQGADKLASLGIEVIDRAGTVEQIAFEAKDWSDDQRRHGNDFGVLVLDQLSHFLPSDPAVFTQRFPGYEPPPARGHKRDMMVWQVKMLTRIAKKLNILIIVMMQMTLSQKQHEKPSHHDLREAKEAAFELDALVIPWRPARIRNEARGMGEPEFVDNEDQRTWILCPIGRQVPQFELEVTWDGAGQRFLDYGTSPRKPWQAPAPVSATALEGMRALAALKERWETRAHERLVGANGGPQVVQGVPELPQLAGPGDQPASPPAPLNVYLPDLF